jgi:hypothetical protein
MKLNKKYCALIDSDNGYDNQLLADCCEQIAEDFAIGFAEWCLDENHIILNDGKELLEIYKKEKGL